MCHVTSKLSLVPIMHGANVFLCDVMIAHIPWDTYFFSLIIKDVVAVEMPIHYFQIFTGQGTMIYPMLS